MYSTYVEPNGEVSKLIDSYTIIGGDYRDNSCQFTIAVNTSVSNMGGHEVYIAPYKADSVYVMGVGNRAVTPKRPFYIEAAGMNMRALIDLDNKFVSIKPYNGKYMDTFILLYNNRVPKFIIYFSKRQKGLF